MFDSSVKPAIPSWQQSGQGKMPFFQRKCTACEKEETEQLQRKETAGGEASSQSVPSIVSSVLGSGSGRPIDGGTRRFMESRFGQDFGQVRIHTGGRAAESATAIQARAYTSGKDIVFGDGEYRPGNEGGKHLLAHELAHVVQQNGPDVNRRTGGARNSPTIARTPQIFRRSCPMTAEERTEVKMHGDLTQRPTPLSCQFDPGFSSNDGEFNFLQGSSDVASLVVSLDSFKSRWRQNGGNANVVLHGFASVEGCEDQNWVLSCSRVLNVRDALTRPRTDGSPGIPASFIETFAQGETNQFSLTNLGRNRVVKISSSIPVAPPAPPSVHDVKVTIKSFIAPIGLRTGVVPFRCFLFDPAHGTGAPNAQTRLQLLASATDAMMRENPTNDAKDKGYRLFTSKTFSVVCDQDQILSIIPSSLDTDSGMEGPFQAPPLTVLHDFSRRDPNSFTFAWAVKGRPHLAVEPGFQAVCPRTSLFIWHSVSGEIRCSGGIPTVTSLSLADSRFPSDRVFVNNVIRKTHPQEEFVRLWHPSTSDRTLVE